MPPVGFEPTISTGKRPQTYALDRTATGTGARTYKIDKYETETKYLIKIILCKGHAVAQLVEALRYKSEGRGFDSRWCHWNFSLT